MMVRTLTAITLVLLALPGLARADEHAGQDMEPLTWVRFYNIHPGHSGDFMNLIREHRAEMMDELVEDGTILSWGIFVPFSHTGDDDWTHGMWITTKDWSHMDSFVAAIEAADTEMSEAEREEMMHSFLEIAEPRDTHDLVSREVASTRAAAGSTPGSPPKYMRLGFYKVKPGHMEQAIGMYNEYALPTLNKLKKNGTVHDAALCVQELVSDNEWSVLSWSLIGDLGTIDKIDDAFEAAGAKRSEAEQEEMMNGFMEHFDWDSFESKIIRVVHLGGQSHQTGAAHDQEHAAEHHAHGN